MSRLTVVLGVALLLAGGCHAPAGSFPAQSASVKDLPDGGKLIGYDVRGAGRATYFQRLNPGGQVVELQFEDNGDGRIEQTVDLSAVDRSAVPHLVILLDGVTALVVEAMWREGHFRLFPPPSRTVSSFPSMTDQGLNELMNTRPSVCYEARFYDRARNAMVGGTADYLKATNSPWMGRVDYRINLTRDADAYLHPWALFRDELAGMNGVFARAAGFGTVIGYTVGTAGVGTTEAEPGMRKYLEEVDRACQEIVYRRRGQVSLTVTADHGQNLVAGKRFSYKKFLAGAGWNVVDSLQADNDVATVEYGLITAAYFWTKSPAKLADTLLAADATDLATYPQADGAIVVRNKAETARVRRVGSGEVGRPGDAYTYDQEPGGDPLKLRPILAKLKAAGKVAANGAIDEAALFQATGDHPYPDPLLRIWLCFNGLVEHPADVVVSMKDDFYEGSAFFDALIHKQSTHGSLNRINSETAVLTTRAPLPALVRQQDILAALGITWARPGRPAKAAATTGPAK